MIKKVPGNKRNKQAQINFHYYCEYCGHTISFYAFEPEKKVCDFCGKLNYKNEFAKFKDKLNEKIKEVNK
jgi:rRNA maturation endonuclease Nob1